MNGPNPLVVLRSMLRARHSRVPRPTGGAGVDHGGLGPVLAAVVSSGVAALRPEPIAGYLAELAEVDPDRLSRPEALAFWLNLYNAGALDLARRARDEAADTVLRLPSGFTTPFIEIAGESLSLDDVEHGKIRRFGDPRIHAALVCGFVSCPTLRHEPYRGEILDAQLDDQMHHFLVSGGAVPMPEEHRISLSRLFRWYGADFVSPGHMPRLRPARRGRVLRALEPWLDPAVAAWIRETGPSIEFQAYDWGLGCSVRIPVFRDARADGPETSSEETR